ncbi:MAG TPA: hypothetical protein VGO49_16280 [Bradyrhizobium sp.]|jgi:hypothetical protein|nr:hypothetical protein [Bradyrhizobium sp.]
MGLVSVVFRAAAIAAAAVSLAACATPPVGPEHPGTQIRYRPPDPQKWVGNRVFGERRSVYRCRPLACPENSVVSIRMSNSPTRSPDPIALQKYAQEDAKREMALAEQASAEAVGRLRDVALLSSRVAPMKNFPAIHWEYRGTLNDKTIYISRDLVFAGVTLVDVLSTSLAIDVARRNGSDFVNVMEIDDFPPPAPGTAQR